MRMTRPLRRSISFAANHFSPHGVFTPLLDALLRDGDYFLHLADLPAYAEAQTRLGEEYERTADWSRKAILIGGSGMFSSDRTIAEYARDIWHVEGLEVGASVSERPR
jgi:glycogen phosphorylase